MDSALNHGQHLIEDTVRLDERVLPVRIHKLFQTENGLGHRRLNGDGGGFVPHLAWAAPVPIWGGRVAPS